MSRAQFQEYYFEYLLGTLEDSDRLRLEAHLMECAECRQTLAELREAFHSLPTALEQRRPPAHLKEKILDQIGGERRQEAAWPWWREWAIAASIVVAILSIAVLQLYRETRLQDQTIASLQEETTDLRRSNQDLTGTIHQLTQPRLRFVNLAGLAGYESVSGSAFVNAEAKTARVFLHSLPQIASEKAFQLWVIEPGKNPHPSNVFKLRGPVTELEVSLPAETQQLAALAVTIEPDQGSPQPTGPMVVLGRF